MRQVSRSMPSAQGKANAQKTTKTPTDYSDKKVEA